MAVRLLCLVVFILAAGGSVPETAAAAPGPPGASCNGGGCGGWFRSNVTVSWSYDPTGVTGTYRLRRGRDHGGHRRRHLRLHGQLRRPVLRQQRHGTEGLEPARRDRLARP